MFFVLCECDSKLDDTLSGTVMEIPSCCVSVTGHVDKQVDGLVLFGTQPSSHVNVRILIRAWLERLYPCQEHCLVMTNLESLSHSTSVTPLHCYIPPYLSESVPAVTLIRRAMLHREHKVTLTSTRIHTHEFTHNSSHNTVYIALMFTCTQPATHACTTDPHY